MGTRGPIILWQTRHEKKTDDAGISILASVLPPPALFDPGPYESPRRVEGGELELNTSLRYVPSLAYFCLKVLLPYPEEIHHFGSPRFRYERPSTPFAYDILRALIPSYCPWPDHCDEDGLQLSQVDPRLWASIIQVFTDLPDELRVYSLALSDKHLPLLQHIPQRADFSLLTVLELPGCPDLTDDTIFELKALHGLCAFDATATQLTAHGILRLSRTMTWTEGEDNASKRRGPWQLRILTLRNCKLIGNRVFDAIATFPLLSVVDLRGTNCSRNLSYFPPFFRPSANQDLFHPTPLLDSLSNLAASPTLFSSDNYYALHIHRRDYGGSSKRKSSNVSYPVSSRPKPSVASEDTFVVLPPSSGATSSSFSAGPFSPEYSKRSKIVIGNAEALAIRVAKREKEHQHALNSMAWVERQERLEISRMQAWGDGAVEFYDGGSLRDSTSPVNTDGDPDSDFSDANPLSCITALPHTLPGDLFIGPTLADQSQATQGGRIQSNSTLENELRLTTNSSAIRSSYQRRADALPTLPRSHPTSRVRVNGSAPQRAYAQPANDIPNARSSSSRTRGTRPPLRQPTTTTQHLGQHNPSAGPIPRQPVAVTAYRADPGTNTPSVRTAEPADGLAASAAVDGARLPDYMNVAASVETQQVVSRQSAEAFYGRRESTIREALRPSLGRRHPVATRETSPSRERSDLGEHTNVPRGEDVLKLYRDPPPWCFMQKPPPSTHRPENTGQRLDQTIAAKRSDERTRKNVDDARALLAKRARTASWQADGFQAEAPTTHAATKPAGPRNPFLARRFASSSNTQRPDVAPGRGTASTSVEAKGRSSLALPGELKSLRPISTIPAPLLPEELKKKLKIPKKSLPPTKGVKMPRPDKDLSSSRKLSLPDLSKSSADRMQATAMSDGKAGLRPADPSLLRKRDAPLPAKKVRASTSVTDHPPSRKSKDPGGATQKRGNKGFDWGAWTAKS